MPLKANSGTKRQNATTDRFLIPAPVYETVVARVLELERRGDAEGTLRWLGLAGSVAWNTHPGRYADERLEAVGRRIGERLQASSPLGETDAVTGHPRANERRSVLHVATSVHDIGGHTRLIENWIKNDPGSLHSLALLDQGECIRSQLIDLIADNGGETFILAEPSLLLRARRLRQLAQARPDCIILHHHPDDPLPLVAFARADCPPVAVMNHADHVYWLGSSIADAIIDYREFGARVSRECRGARKSLSLPLPVELGNYALGRDEARSRLGISPGDVALLSMGNAYKYAPTQKQNFFRTIDQVLARNQNARLWLVGVSSDDLRSFGVSQHERVHALGVLSDPSIYQAAADIYLEGFPYGSYTALMETAARGVCPVLMYAATPKVSCLGDPALEGLVTSATDEADYIAAVTALINDGPKRAKLAQAVAQRITSTHQDLGKSHLPIIYDYLAATKHAPGPLPHLAFAQENDNPPLTVHPPQRKPSTLARSAKLSASRLTLRDTLRVLAMSLRIGDTRPRLADARAWLSLFWQRARGDFARRPQ